MMEMTEQTISDQTINKLEEQMDDTEEGEILEDGEIADEDETISSSGDHHKTEEKEIKNSSNYRENDCYNNRDNRDSRRRDSENRKSEDRNRDKDKSSEKERRSDRDRDRERRDRHERNERSERDRKSSSTDRERRDTDRDRKTSSVVTNSEDERRRKERDRKRRRSDEEDRDERQKETEKRKRNRDQNWSEYNNSNNESNNNNNNRNNNNFDDFERRPFEDFDFRIPETHGFSMNNTNMGPMRERDLNNDDNEDLNFDERDFEEMLQIMEHRMPSNRVGAMDAIEKKEMMRAMAVMMRRNLDSDKGKRLARLRERRRINERQPGPTGTRAVLQRAPPDSQQRQAPFKQICKYFLEGKCHKGADCPFSHDAMPPKKKELCKFYLQGFCGKGEDCLFMHSEFPCKFFHTNVECYSGDNCRFSHCPLTEETREILRNYLDSGTLPDDPKPERQHRQHSNTDNNNTDNNNKSNSYKESQNQNNSQTISDNSSAVPSMSSGTGFTPTKPVIKRHAILGDPTPDIKNSHQTWIWQQEMKELEVAYVGNKRNLFCIEKPFVLTEKPSTPRMEDDEEEIEAQIRNYYKDTMPELAEADTDHRQQQQQPSPPPPVEVVVSQPICNDEQKLIEASAHDEDLRTLLLRPRSHTNESMNTEINNDIDERLQTSSSKVNITEESQSKPQSLQEVPQNVPKVARDLYLKMQNKLQNENEIKSNDWQSDSDDDDKNVLAAALKNVQQSSKHSSPSDKISKMLSIIRNSSNTSANQSPQQSEFWQNIMSGIHMSAGGSPSAGNSTPPRPDYRDPRLKRSGKESMSPTITESPSPAVKICDPNVKIEYKLVPIRAADIDYSTYVSIYRIDARLKNDPRLQKFFSRLPSSEIDNLSRIVPPPLKMAPVTPLSVLKSKKKSDKEHQKDNNNKRERTPKANSPTLPPLPPLTISPSKPVTTPGIFPPTPPPIMSPLELISSRPTYTVSADTKSHTKIEVKNENTVIISKTDGNKQTIDSINDYKVDIKPEPILSPPPPLLFKNTPLHSLTSSPENIEPIIKTQNESPIEAQRIAYLSENNYFDSTVDSIVKSAANNVSTDEQVVIKPVLSSLPLIPSKYMPSPQTSISSLTTELFETALNTSINSDIQRERDDLKIDDQMETSSNYSTEDDLYDNLYPSQTNADDLSAVVSVTEQRLDSQKPMSSSSSPRSSIDEFELIRNELKGPTLSIDSDNELEIDLRQRKDSVSEVESADECELMIASASETEDNNESDVTNSSINNIANDLQNNENNVSFDEPMNLSVSDVQNSGSDGNQTSDQSLKSVFSTIDPTASPFC